MSQSSIEEEDVDIRGYELPATVQQHDFPT